MKEYVNHPAHYNQHPCGIECISIIRHYVCDTANAVKYLWRAGLKTELGKSDAEKEIEDLEKALWYINDYLSNKTGETINYIQKNQVEVMLIEQTGYSISQITDGYCQEIALAMGLMLHVGIIHGGEVRHAVGWPYLLAEAIENIEKYILKLRCNQDL